MGEEDLIALQRDLGTDFSGVVISTTFQKSMGGSNNDDVATLNSNNNSESNVNLSDGVNGAGKSGSTTSSATTTQKKDVEDEPVVAPNGEPLLLGLFTQRDLRHAASQVVRRAGLKNMMVRFGCDCSDCL